MSGVNDSGSQRMVQEVLSQAVHSFSFLIAHHLSQKTNNASCPAALQFLSPQLIFFFLTMQSGLCIAVGKAFHNLSQLTSLLKLQQCHEGWRLKQLAPMLSPFNGAFFCCFS